MMVNPCQSHKSQVDQTRVAPGTHLPMVPTTDFGPHLRQLLDLLAQGLRAVARLGAPNSRARIGGDVATSQRHWGIPSILPLGINHCVKKSVSIGDIYCLLLW